MGISLDRAFNARAHRSRRCVSIAYPRQQQGDRAYPGLAELDSCTSPPRDELRGVLRGARANGMPALFDLRISHLTDKHTFR
jgi:hypothetical protein